MAQGRLLVIGSYLSPFVRKVLVALHVKQLPYAVEPLVGFWAPAAFEKISPLKRIPVLIDGDTVVNDSSVIVQYLEERFPSSPPLLPVDVSHRARTRWLEEYADTYLADVLVWRLYNEQFLRKNVWGEDPREEVLASSRQEINTTILPYLEQQAPAPGKYFLDLSTMSVGDIAVASLFRSAALAKFVVDENRFPRTAAWLATTWAQPAFTSLEPFEQVSRKTKIPDQRRALTEAGAPIAITPYGEAEPTPRPGVLYRR
jgi:glutathione S-transferase